MVVIRVISTPEHVGVEFTEQWYNHSHFHERTNFSFLTLNIKHLKVKKPRIDLDRVLKQNLRQNLK